LKKIWNIFLNIPIIDFILSIFRKEEYVEILPVDPVSNGKKVILIRDYPIKSFKLIKGKVYDVVEEYVAEKQITAYAKIHLNFIEIIADDGKVVMVSLIFFEFVD